MLQVVAFHGNSCGGKSSAMAAIAALCASRGIATKVMTMPYDSFGHVDFYPKIPAQMLEQSLSARLHFIYKHLADIEAVRANFFHGFLLSDMTIFDLMNMYLMVCRKLKQKSNDWIFDLLDQAVSYDLVFDMPEIPGYIKDGCRKDDSAIKDSLSYYYDGRYDLSEATNCVKKLHVVKTLDRTQRTEEVLNVFKETYLPSTGTLC